MIETPKHSGAVRAYENNWRRLRLDSNLVRNGNAVCAATGVGAIYNPPQAIAILIDQNLP
jgi:hypothetical protein